MLQIQIVNIVSIAHYLFTDLMRSVENYEAEHLSTGHDDSFREMSTHSNIHDKYEIKFLLNYQFINTYTSNILLNLYFLCSKSEGGGSMGGWSNDGSMCRVRNSLPQRHKFTNEQHSQQHSQQHPQQLHAQQHQHAQHQQHAQPHAQQQQHQHAQQQQHVQQQQQSK